MRRSNNSRKKRLRAAKMQPRARRTSRQRECGIRSRTVLRRALERITKQRDNRVSRGRRSPCLNAVTRLAKAMRTHSTMATAATITNGCIRGSTVPHANQSRPSDIARPEYAHVTALHHAPSMNIDPLPAAVLRRPQCFLYFLLSFLACSAIATKPQRTESVLHMVHMLFRIHKSAPVAFLSLEWINLLLHTIHLPKFLRYRPASCASALLQHRPQAVYSTLPVSRRAP